MLSAPASAVRGVSAVAAGPRRTAAAAVPKARPAAASRSRNRLRVAADAAAGAEAPAPAAPVSIDAASDLQVAPASNGARFVWTRAWYPVAALDYLDASRPSQVTLLGHDLVVWRDAEGQWRCFRDSCPHRAAPLSEGRIHPATGNLECAYHGWQFGGGGGTQEIPQSEPGAAKATACASKRSCAAAFPTAQAHGLLWAWLEAGAEAAAQAEATPLPVLPAADPAGRAWFPVSPWYVRELQVDYLPLMENSCDPGHVHFTHAGFIGSPDKAGPLTVKLLEQDERGVYRFVCEDAKRATFRNLVLQPPCMLWASSEGMTPDGELGLLYFVVPVAPGRSRLMSLPLATNPKMRTLAKIFHWQPWIRHLFNHTVAAQDIVLLHRQGTNMATPAFQTAGWRKGFYLPTTSDSGIVVLRQWLERVAGGGVAWGPNVPAGGAEPIQPETRREVLLDHYHQHTEHCPHCRKALANVRDASAGLLGVAGASFLGLAVALGRGAALTAPTSVALLCAVAAALALRAKLADLQQAFLFTDWRHSERR